MTDKCFERLFMLGMLVFGVGMTTVLTLIALYRNADLGGGAVVCGVITFCGLCVWAFDPEGEDRP